MCPTKGLVYGAGEMVPLLKSLMHKQERLSLTLAPRCECGVRACSASGGQAETDDPEGLLGSQPTQTSQSQVPEENCISKTWWTAPEELSEVDLWLPCAHLCVHVY